MTIPDYQSFMLPLLQELSDGKDRRLRDVVKQLADHFKLSDAEQQQLLPSGQQTVVSNRVAWAKTYLKAAGLVASPSRGIIQITEIGKKILSQHPAKIDNQFLEQFPSFVAFVSKDGGGTVEVKKETKTPEELLESSYQTLHDALAAELLERVKSCSPEFFERLAVELLVAMGYGGSLADAGQAIGRSGDGGIDGTIKEDKLGLDVVYIQAKRWENTVGRPVVQAFAGSMEGVRARKGVLITTANFSKEAQEYVGKIERKIVLIDGRRLADLMIDYGVGVMTAQTYLVKKMDADYFLSEEG